MRKYAALVLWAALALVAQRASASDDASAGYVAIRPALVKVWTFDAAGRPLQSGTGVVVDSSDRRSLVLTASHVIAGAASIRIDVSRELHDLTARVDRTGPRDLSLLAVDRGGLRAAHFAARSRAVVEGNLVAVAGYVKNDELIGEVGQEPRVLFPGTVSSRPDNGLYLELENVHIEEGLSGGAVFDPQTGEILGIVTSRTSDRRGGFADSGALVVVPFLEANHVAAVDVPRTPHVAAPPRIVAVAPPPTPAPAPQAFVAVSAPRDAASGAVSWRAGLVTPKRFLYVRDGCRVAVTIDVQTLQFVIAHQALVQPHHNGELLSIALAQRAGANDACSGVADAEPVDGAYTPTAMSYNGHHVTMRFAYAGDPENTDRFPADASLDADLDGDTASATLQFFAARWTGSIDLPLSRTAPASVSSTR